MCFIVELTDQQLKHSKMHILSSDMLNEKQIAYKRILKNQFPIFRLVSNSLKLTTMIKGKK